MSYQIFEVRLDAAGNDIERVPAWIFETAEEAAKRIENVLLRYVDVIRDPGSRSWTGIGPNGVRVRFLIDEYPSETL